LRQVLVATFKDPTSKSYVRLAGELLPGEQVLCLGWRSLVQIRSLQPKFLLCQSLPQALQSSGFVNFIAKDIENSPPTPSSTAVCW
jgi:hypothetical protein